MQLSKKEKAFYQFFRYFMKCRSNIEHFEAKDDPRNLRTI